MTARVVVADATAFVRLAVRAALEEDGIHVVAEAASPSEVLTAVALEQVDVVLLDAELDPSFEVVAGLRQSGAAVVLLVSDASTEAAWTALRSGACGVVPKDGGTERLAAIVCGVAAGEAALPRAVVRELLDGLYDETRRRARGAAEGLSRREQDVMDLLSEGHDDDEIASRLGISATTVRRHVGTAAQKLGAGGRPDAIDRYRGVTDDTSLAV